MRTSPGSPSQMMAALFLRQVWTWRSRQLYERLILPPTNHFAHGQSHSSTLSHGLNQCSSRAMSAQKPSGSAAARAHSLVVLFLAVDVSVLAELWREAETIVFGENGIDIWLLRSGRVTFEMSLHAELLFFSVSSNLYKHPSLWKSGLPGNGLLDVHDSLSAYHCSNVERSPISAPVSCAFSSRRMILPDRVFGNAYTN